MPQRAISILTGLAGLGALAFLVLMGADLLCAARSGPRWKRELLTAGILLLAALGLTSCRENTAPPSAPPPGSGSTNPASDSLADSTEWKTVLDAWTFVEPLAQSGKSTTAQRKTADAKLEAARNAITKLTHDNLLIDAEAGLLLSEADRLRKDLYRNAPVPAPGEPMVMCYEPTVMPPAARVSLDRLSQRLPLLTQLADSGKLHPQVMDKLLPSITKDVNVLGTQKEIDKLPQSERAQAVKTRDAVQAQLDAIQARLKENR